MKLSHLSLMRPVKGFPPDAKRARDEVDATDDVTLVLVESLVEVRHAGVLILLIPSSWAVMTPAK